MDPAPLLHIIDEISGLSAVWAVPLNGKCPMEHRLSAWLTESKTGTRHLHKDQFESIKERLEESKILFGSVHSWTRVEYQFNRTWLVATVGDSKAKPKAFLTKQVHNTVPFTVVDRSVGFDVVLESHISHTAVSDEAAMCLKSTPDMLFYRDSVTFACSGLEIEMIKSRESRRQPDLMKQEELYSVQIHQVKDKTAQVKGSPSDAAAFLVKSVLSLIGGSEIAWPVVKKSNRK